MLASPGQLTKGVEITLAVQAAIYALQVNLGSEWAPNRPTQRVRPDFRLASGLPPVLFKSVHGRANSRDIAEGIADERAKRKPKAATRPNRRSGQPQRAPLNGGAFVFDYR
jgi:hypothetical protein